MKTYLVIDECERMRHVRDLEKGSMKIAREDARLVLPGGKTIYLFTFHAASLQLPLAARSRLAAALPSLAGNALPQPGRYTGSVLSIRS